MPHPYDLPSELGPFAEELRRLFADLDSQRGPSVAACHGECQPALDVIESAEAVEVTIDLPGVTARDIRVIVRGGLILVAGDKHPLRPAAPRAAFHLAERGFGRFARMVRLSSAYRRPACDRRTAPWRAPDRGPEAAGAARRPDPRSDPAGRLTRPRAGRPDMNSGMHILFIGDIVGRPGRDLVQRGLEALVDHYAIDLVIANAENAAGGFGITREIGEALLDAGVDVMTSGNHIWDKKEALDYIGIEPRLLRPANFPAGAPGRGGYLARTAAGRPVGVINVMGRVFMPILDDPFAVVLREVEALREHTRIIFVDFHAEATSEKVAMAWHLDGRATAVVGTHTHVQTADARLLPGGTAAITDVGMTGPHDSIIGVVKEAALSRFLTGMPSRFETATGDPRMNAVVVEADEATGRATNIERLNLSADDLQRLADTTRASAVPAK